MTSSGSRPDGSRIMVAQFDSVAQGRSWREQGELETGAAMRSAVRLATLLGGRTVVTDAQLLDGIWFLSVGPDGVSHALGLDPDTPLPFSVSTREESLSAALDAMMSRPDFVWSSDGAAAEHGDLDAALGEARREWIAAADRGIVDLIRVSPEEFSLEVVLEAFRPPSALPDALVQRLRGSGRRSAAYRLLDAELADDPELFGAARDWFDRGYAAALADQHAASWLDFGGGRRRAGQKAETAGMRAPTPVSGRLLDTLGTMPAALFSLVHTRSVEARVEWDGGRPEDAVRTLAMVAREATEAAPRWRSAQARAWTTSTLLALLAVATLMTMWIPGLDRWLVVPVVTVLATNIPWEKWKYLSDNRSGRLKADIHLRGGL